MFYLILAVVSILCGLAALDVAPALAIISLVVAGVASGEVWRDVRQRFS
jgi:hypothetical protein